MHDNKINEDHNIYYWRYFFKINMNIRCCTISHSSDEVIHLYYVASGRNLARGPFLGSRQFLFFLPPHHQKQKYIIIVILFTSYYIWKGVSIRLQYKLAQCILTTFSTIFKNPQWKIYYLLERWQVLYASIAIKSF